MNPVDNGALFHRSSGHRDCTQLPLRRVHSLSRGSTVSGISFFKDTCAGSFTNPETSFRRVDRPASGCQEKAGHRPAWRPTPGPSCAGSRQGRRPAAHRGRGPFSRQYFLLHPELSRAKSDGVTSQPGPDHDGPLPDTSKRERTRRHLRPRSWTYRRYQMVDRLPSSIELQTASNRSVPSKQSMPGAPGRSPGNYVFGESGFQP